MTWILMILAVAMIVWVAKYTRLHMTDNDPEELEIVKKELEIIKDQLR